MEVVIDGVRYVPVVEAHANAKAIMCCLAESFWGVLKPDDPDLAGKLDGLRVRVYDDEKGEPIADVVASIIEAIGRT